MTTATNRVVTVDDSAIKVNGKRAELYGGAIHYWRLDRDKWEKILDLTEVEDATGNLVSLPRNVDGDHGETEVDDFVENLLPLVTVETPVVDGTTVKFCTFAVHLDR